jgi:hypothetical protein
LQQQQSRDAEAVARECLIWVGFNQLPTVRDISLQWKVEVESPNYNCLRSAECLACDGTGAAQAPRVSTRPSRRRQTVARQSRNNYKDGAAANGHQDSDEYK